MNKPDQPEYPKPHLSAPAEMPDHLRRMHDAVEGLRAKSYELIKHSEDLSRHVALVECCMDLLHAYAAGKPPKGENEDQQAVRLLGMRLFNGCASAFDLVASGFYQNAAMVMRDLLETVFLLGYFDLAPKQVELWRKADAAERIKNFAPVKIRIALDERDGFTEKKRAASYNMLCELAAHPTYQGFAMLKPRGLDHHHCGPYVEASALQALIEELVKLAIQAANNFGAFFKPETPEQRKIQLEYLEAGGEWAQRYFGRPFDREGFQLMKAEAVALGLITGN